MALKKIDAVCFLVVLNSKLHNFALKSTLYLELKVQVMFFNKHEGGIALYHWFILQVPGS